MAKNEESFADVINRAGKLPDDFQGGAGQLLPNLFNLPIPTGEKVILDQPPGRAKGAIAGIAEYNFTAHFKRFMIGQQIVGVNENGTPIYEDIDESAEYQEVLNMILSAKAVLRWEERTFLRDGTTVIAMCYMMPKEKKKDSASTEGGLTLAELKNPNKSEGLG